MKKLFKRFPVTFDKVFEYRIIIFVFICSIIFIMNLNSIPYMERTISDPYFHIENLLPIFWVGYVTCLIFILVYIYKNNFFNKFHYSIILIIFMFTVYIYVLPVLSYKNHIYVDTYLFVGELLHILKNNRLGYGWSLESPGLSIVSSSLNLISGIDYLNVVDIMLILIPLLYILYFYLMTTVFIDTKRFPISYLIIVAMNWFGFHFNRQSYSIIIQLFTFYLLLKVLYDNDFNLSNYVILFISYISLIISHPASPFILCMNIFTMFIFIYLLKRFSTDQQFIIKIEEMKILRKTFLIGLTFFGIYLYWQTAVHGALFLAYRNLLYVLSELTGLVSPTGKITAIISSYSNLYGPIVNFRLVESYLVTIIGNLLSFYILYKKHDIKNIILASWFIGSNWLLIFVLYSRSWIYRPIMFSLPSLAIMITILIMDTNKSAKYLSYIKNGIKFTISSFIMILLLSLPLIMYAHSPFFYPPSTYLNELDFLTTYLSGPTAIFEASSELRYHVLKNDSNMTYLSFTRFYNLTTGLQRERIYNAKGITTTFRAYTKAEFVSAQPSMMDIIAETETTLNGLPGFGRVYDSDRWHKIYVNLMR